MSTMLSGSISAFDIALETGSAYYDMKSGNFYRFDEYKRMKSMRCPCSGVYLTDANDRVDGLWRESDVQKYIRDHNLTLEY